MNIPDFHNVIQALGWTLVHFIWQGAAIGLLFGIAMRLASPAGARLRYRLALALFMGAGVIPVVTFWMVLEAAHAPVTSLAATEIAARVGGAMEAGSGAGWLQMLELALEPYLAWAVAFWLAGVIVMSGRVCMDWWQVRRLTWVGVEPLPVNWNSRVRELVHAFGVRRPVRVLRSTIVRVPAVIGWLRPVILIPTAALAGLSPRQLELIIAHELAHIRRADYLVNLIQVVIETVLFYHPAVRWMSNRVRQERELCCDDAVITTCGDTLTYAQALTELEVQRQAGFQTALAASGGQLSQRIYRMLESPVPRRNTLVWGMSLVVGLAAGSMALAAQMALSNGSQPETRVPSRENPSAAGPVMSAEAASTEAPASTRSAETEPAEPASATRSAGRTPDSGTEEFRSPDNVLLAALGDRRADAGNSSARTRQDETVDLSATPRQAREAAATESAPDGGAPAQAGDNTPDAGPEPRVVDARVVDERSEPEPVPRVEPSDAALAPLPQLDALAGTREPPEPDDSEDTAQQLASAARPESKAAESARPEVRGGQALHLAAPQYPRRARIRGLQGAVEAQFVIGRDGRVRDIEVTESSPTGVFDRAVEQALRDWRFEPMTRDGEPVTRRMSKVFAFNLEGEPGASELESDECDPVTGTRICRQ